jgi:hypothetical protein
LKENLSAGAGTIWLRKAEVFWHEREGQLLYQELFDWHANTHAQRLVRKNIEGFQ